MTTGLYLYGIFPTPGPQALEVAGLDQQPVYIKPIDEFVFLYSEAKQERYPKSRNNLLGHERVLEQAMQLGYRTLLPLQFGVVISDWETVKTQLTTPKEKDLKQLFDKLEGKREISIKIFWDSDNELEQLMQEDDRLQAERDRLKGKNLSMDEVVRLGQTIEQAMENRKLSIIQAFQQTLTPLAIDVVENDVPIQSMIYNTAYLIPWETESQFSEQVEVLDRQFENRLRIRYNNFTAPFNFAQLP